MEPVETYFSEALSEIEDNIALEAVSNIDFNEALSIFPEIEGLEGIALEAVSGIDFNDALGKPISFLTEQVVAFQENKNTEKIQRIGLKITNVGNKYTLTYPNVHPNNRSDITVGNSNDRTLKEIYDLIKKRGLDKDFPDYKKIIQDQTGQKVDIEEAAPKVDIEEAAPKGDYREVTMEIVSIGRKWIKGTYPGKTFKYEILKNNISESFEVGQQYTFDAAVEDKSTKYGKKIVVTPIDTATKEKIKEEKLSGLNEIRNIADMSAISKAQDEMKRLYNLNKRQGFLRSSDKADFREAQSTIEFAIEKLKEQGIKSKGLDELAYMNVNRLDRDDPSDVGSSDIADITREEKEMSKLEKPETDLPLGFRWNKRGELTEDEDEY